MENKNIWAINENDISLINPKNKNKGFSLDLFSNEINIDNIPIILSFIDGFQLNTNIFEPKWNNSTNGWGVDEKRGREDYVPPLGWDGYGLKVKGKYDNGDDTWLDYEDKEGVYAIAYFGLSNVYGNKQNYIEYINEIKSEEALKIGYEQTYKNDIDLRNPDKKYC